jgi:cell division protein FtsB
MSLPAVRAAQPAGRPSARPAARPPALRAVPAAIQRPGHLVFASVCMALLSAGLVALLMLNTAMTKGSFDLQQLVQTSAALADRQEALAQSLDSYRSPSALANRARRLGLVSAESMAFIRLEDGKVLGTATPAAPPPIVVKAAPKPTKATTTTKKSTKKSTTTSTKTSATNKSTTKTKPKTTSGAR